MAETLLLRGIGIRARARSLKRIAAFVNLPAQIAGGAARPAEIFKSVVMRLEIFIGDAPILDRHVFGKEARAIALGQMRFQHEVAGQKSPGFSIPVHASAPDTIRRHESAPRADRESGLIHLVAERKCVLVRPEEELMPDAIPQFILRIVWRIIGRGIAPWATLDGNHVETFVRQLVRKYRSGPSESDDDYVLAG